MQPDERETTVNGVAVFVVALVLAGLFAPGAAIAGDSAEELFNQGRWDEASEEALLRDDAASMRFRSRFSVWAGDDDDALRFAQTAVELSGSSEQRRRSVVELARREWLYGDRERSIERLREALGDSPDDMEVRYELGWRLVADGAADEGRAVLEGVARRYNDGLITEVDDLVWAGRAMAAAERPRDANRALSRALREDEEHLEANLRLGQLMLDRHNTAEAEGAFKAVLERYEDHPEALVGMAEIEFFQSGRFRESMELVDRARDSYPGHPEVIRGRAELLIAQGAWEEGRDEMIQFLKRAPDDGQALALLAAAAYLLIDDESFDEATKRFDARRPTRPDLYSTVGEFAALNNRHRASVQFFEKALERREDYAPALTGLGMALTRTGEEARGIGVLEQAFDADRFRVPVYNTLELYDRGLRDYMTDDVDGFRLRAHHRDFDLIREMVEPLVAEARREFDERYGVELPSLSVEIFADREAFSVRSVGLPHIDPHGICFGRVVLTRGPGDGNFNWPMVVWHELAHSYHLELSGERVPVWFTEGLAEYETRLRDPSWTRFHDLDVVRRVVHGQMWSFAEMDEVFMTGRGADVSQAYQVAMLVMAFLDETYGFEVIVDMLERFADTPRTEEVFQATLQMTTEAIDEKFDQWLRRRYSGLFAQELVDWSRLHAMLNDEDVDHRSEAEGSAYRAMVAAVRGDEERAGVLLRNSERQDDSDLSAMLIRALVYDAIDDIERGLEVGREVLDSGVESFDLRYAMSQMAERADRRTEAYVHALAATTLAPQESEGWRQLQPRAKAVDEEVRAGVALRELFARSPHSAELARRRLGFFEEYGDYDGAYSAARRWTEVAALDARSHLAMARVAARRGELDKAQAAWERAALASPARSREIWQTAVDELSAAGADELAKRYKRRLQTNDD